MICRRNALPRSHWRIAPGRACCTSRLNRRVWRGSWQDRRFREFPELLRPDDLLVLNNTRVFPARLYGHRSGQRRPAPEPAQSGGTRFSARAGRSSADAPGRRDDPNEWECLVRPGRKIGIGEKLYFGAQPPGRPSRTGSRGHRARQLSASGASDSPSPDFFARVERIGHVPLPPYIDRDDRAVDRERYQTVYAQRSRIGGGADCRAAFHA
jgi:S-adenosylmethionine:tRNA ribosyltransferase-isomerase